MLLTIRMIAESDTAAETEYIAHRMLSKAVEAFERYLISDIQPYWKIEGCYEASINAQCKKELGVEEAIQLIERITNKVSWSSYGVDGVADSRLEILGSTFEHHAVRFCSFLFTKGDRSMSDEYRISRTIGEPSLFSIRFQLDEHFGGDRMYGRFSMNVMGSTLADGETGLGDLFMMLTDVARDSGNRAHPELFQLETEKLFERLHDVFYEGNNAESAEEEAWARFNISIPDHTLSMKSIFVIAGKEYDRLLIADYDRRDEPGWRTEYILPLGIFDGVIVRAHRELQSLHEWKVRGSRGAMKVLDLEQPPDFSPSEEHLKCGLPTWYAEVRVKRLDELTVEDLCRFVRQELYVDELLPNVLEILTENAFAGTLYRGELLRALSNLPADFWGKHDRERESWKPIIRELRQEIEDHLQAAERLLERME